MVTVNIEVVREGRRSQAMVVVPPVMEIVVVMDLKDTWTMDLEKVIIVWVLVFR